MYIVLFLIGCALISFVAYHVIAYRNPYKLYMCFGKKGSGKTTLMTKLCLQYRKKGWNVYCDREIPGAVVFPTDAFGKYQFPPNSLILIDEVGLVWDNRNFKSFPEHVKVYFKYQRQYRHVVYLFSQSFDVDKKIRDLTDHLYIIQNYANCFSIARRVTKFLTVSHASSNVSGESKIVDDYKIDSLWLFFLGTVKVTYIPKYAKYFKSYNPPQLVPWKGEPVPMPAKAERPARQRRLRAALERQSLLRKWNKK